MSQPFILYRYIAREIIGYSFIALLMITVVLVAGDVGSELVPLIAKGVSLGDVVHLALLTLPMVLSYSIPMAFVFGLLAAYGRLSGDLEIAAMRASGLHIGHLLLPALVIGLVLSLAIGKFSLDLEAPARAQARLTLRAIAVSKPVITPGQFHTFRAHVLMVDRKDKDGTLRGVFISDFSDRNKPFEVFAETGKLSSDQDLAQIKLDLSDGAIHLFNKEITNEDRRISFEHMQYAFRFGDAEDVPQGLPWRPHDASTEALREVIAHLGTGEPLPEHLSYMRPKIFHRYAMEYYRRYATAVLPLLFPLLCVPLGLRRHRHSNSSGALICLGIIFCYYTIYGFGESLGERQALAPLPSIWLASALLVLVSIPLLVRANRSGV